MTIVDRREIEFSASGVVRIIGVSLKAAQGFGLPGMPPSGARFHPSNGRIDLIYGGGQSAQAISIGAEALGALLVSYCIRARIPMPRAADKGIRIESNSVVLAFRSKYDDPPAPQAPEGGSRPAKAVTAWTWLPPEKVPNQ